MISENNRALYLKDIFHGPIKELYLFWFNPKQYLPPFNEFLDMSFKEGGFWRASLSLPQKQDILVYGEFISLETNKSIITTWKGLTNSNFLLTLNFKEEDPLLSEISLSLTGESIEVDVFNKKAIHLYFLTVKAFFEKNYPSPKTTSS